MIVWLRIAFAFFVIVVTSILLMPLQVLALTFDWKLRRTLPRHWHRIICYCLGIRIRVRGRLENRRPLMLCSNHSSWMDIMVMSAVADVAFIAKIEVRDWPIFGTLAKLQKSVFVVREEKRRTGDQASEIAGRMADGEIVVLFPEGTTSDGNRLLEVKSSLFGAAAMAVPHSPTGAVMVQPVAIAYTRVHGIAMGRYHRPLAAWPGDLELLPHLIDILKCGAIDAEVSFGEAVEYGEKTNRKAVSSTISARIRNLLNSSLRGRDIG
ncbi:MULTISPECIES: lysophospholipid acyltransferase family protein [unclassified Rhizobium]|uniref:lysophospholipid acyltransferase family protein n=1 Tax=Rhizobium sp. GCM10022189 TaxID=3252654 RepID=UPI000DDB1B42